MTRHSPFTIFTFPCIRMFPIRPPLNFPNANCLTYHVPTRRTIRISNLPIANSNLTYAPHRAINITIRIHGRLFRRFRQHTIVNGSKLRIVLPLIRATRRRILRIILTTMRTSVMNVFLYINLFQTMFLLCKRPLSQCLRVITSQRSRRLPNNRIRHRRRFYPRFLNPPKQ